MVKQSMDLLGAPCFWLDSSLEIHYPRCTGALSYPFSTPRHSSFRWIGAKLVITNLCVPPVGTADRARRHDQGRPNMGRAPFLVSLEMVAFATLLVL